MTDEEVEAALAEKLAHHEAQAERYRKMLALAREEGPVVQAPPGKRRAMTPAKGGKKSTRRIPSDSEGEQRPRKGKAAGPGRGNGSNAQRSAERKASALALLAQGVTPKEVAQQLGVTRSAIYLYQKSVK